LKVHNLAEISSYAAGETGAKMRRETTTNILVAIATILAIAAITQKPVKWCIYENKIKIQPNRKGAKLILTMIL